MILGPDSKTMDYEEALEHILDLARTGAAPMAMNLTPEEWQQHKLDRIAAIASAVLEKQEA